MTPREYDELERRRCAAMSLAEVVAALDAHTRYVAALGGRRAGDKIEADITEGEAIANLLGGPATS